MIKAILPVDVPLVTKAAQGAELRRFVVAREIRWGKGADFVVPSLELIRACNRRARLQRLPIEPKNPELPQKGEKAKKNRTRNWRRGSDTH